MSRSLVCSKNLKIFYQLSGTSLKECISESSMISFVVLGCHGFSMMPSKYARRQILFQAMAEKMSA